MIERAVESPNRATGIGLLFFLASSLTAVAANWQSTVSNDPPGPFPELRPLRATYHFGWAGVTAATGEVHFTKPSEDRFQFEGVGRTTGFVRILWKLDANYRAFAHADTLRPIESSQTEAYRSKKFTTHLIFTSDGVKRIRTEDQVKPSPAKTREFTFPNLFDLDSAMLYLRSQPLRDSSVYRVVVYPATSAYLATVTVIGREKISVRAGTYSAIKIDLRLSKVGKSFELEPHRKFRRATIWVSDDADRVLLRAEAQIFIGTVFAELQSLRFDNAKP